MAKKRKARRMPAHVVLPNGMWRFVKRGAKTRSSTKRRTITKRPKRSGLVMARRRRRVSTRARVSKGFNLMKGVIPVRGIVASAIIGVGAAMLAERFAPNAIPQQSLLISAAVGGLPGAAATFFLTGAGFGGGGGGNGITYF